MQHPSHDPDQFAPLHNFPTKKPYMQSSHEPLVWEHLLSGVWKSVLSFLRCMNGSFGGYKDNTLDRETQGQQMGKIFQHSTRKQVYRLCGSQRWSSRWRTSQSCIVQAWQAASVLPQSAWWSAVCLGMEVQEWSKGKVSHTIVVQFVQFMRHLGGILSKKSLSFPTYFFSPKFASKRFELSIQSLRVSKSWKSFKTPQGLFQVFSQFKLWFACSARPAKIT